MITTDFTKRLEWLDNNLYCISESEMELEETKEDGYAKLLCRLNNYSICFLKLEKKRLQYFKHGKCADSLMFEKVSQDDWHIHVFEFKRKVKSGSWEHIKEQFKGALLNATALMGVLGIKSVIKISCYTIYRENKIEEDPILFKAPVGEKVVDHPFIDWVTGNMKIDIIPDKLVKHEKIALDTDTGYGEIAI